MNMTSASARPRTASDRIRQRRSRNVVPESNKLAVMLVMQKTSDWVGLVWLREKLAWPNDGSEDMKFPNAAGDRYCGLRSVVRALVMQQRLEERINRVTGRYQIRVRQEKGSHQR
jgi:hypothetical protein